MDSSGLAVVFCVDASAAEVEGSASVKYAIAPFSLEHVHVLAAGHDGVPSTVRVHTTSFASVGYFPRASQRILRGVYRSGYPV